VLSYCPANDLEGLNLIILRQPKRKEEIFRPCWGRLIYQFEYNGELQPANILEAINLSMDRELKSVLKKSMISPFYKKELLFLQAEGHEVIDMGRSIIVRTTFQAAKNTQLYRTLLHEIGHYVFPKTKARQITMKIRNYSPITMQKRSRLS